MPSHCQRCGPDGYPEPATPGWEVNIVTKGPPSLAGLGEPESSPRPCIQNQPPNPTYNISSTNVSENRFMGPRALLALVLTCKALAVEFSSLPAAAPFWPGPGVTEASACTSRRSGRARQGRRAVHVGGEAGIMLLGPGWLVPHRPHPPEWQEAPPSCSLGSQVLSPIQS